MLQRYVWTREGWVYLAVILDLHSRRVIGWAISKPSSRAVHRGHLWEGWQMRDDVQLLRMLAAAGA